MVLRMAKICWALLQAKGNRDYMENLPALRNLQSMWLVHVAMGKWTTFLCDRMKVLFIFSIDGKVSLQHSVSGLSCMLVAEYLLCAKAHHSSSWGQGTQKSEIIFHSLCHRIAAMITLRRGWHGKLMSTISAGVFLNGVVLSMGCDLFAQQEIQGERLQLERERTAVRVIEKTLWPRVSSRITQKKTRAVGVIKRYVWFSWKEERFLWHNIRFFAQNQKPVHVPTVFWACLFGLYEFPHLKPRNLWWILLKARILKKLRAGKTIHAFLSELSRTGAVLQHIKVFIVKGLLVWWSGIGHRMWFEYGCTCSLCL